MTSDWYFVLYKDNLWQNWWLQSHVFIHVVDTPKFFCEKSYAVELHQTDVMINCTVSADPPVEDFKVMWEQQNEGNVSVSEGESMGHYTANMNGVGIFSL